MKFVKVMLLGVILAVFFVFSLYISRKEEANAKMLAGFASAKSIMNDEDASSLSTDEHVNKLVYDKCKGSIVEVFSYVGSILNREGTGVVVRPHAILTNYHVVADSSRFVIRTHDGKVLNVSIVGYDEENDLALLDSSAALPAIEIDSSAEPEIGDRVLSLSYLNGVGLFMSSGIIGSVSKPIRNENGNLVSGFMGSDTVILNGASGSALLSKTGKFVGLNYAVYSDRTSRGISYSIPSKFTEEITTMILRQTGKIRRGGVDFLGADLAFDPRLNTMSLNAGVAVVGLVPGGEAEKALKVGATPITAGNVKMHSGGDVVVRLNGCEIRNVDDIYTSLATAEAGDEVGVSFFRDGKLNEGRIKLVSREAGYERRFFK
ncbi:MAG TPA: hypothetical protein DCO86_02985 [Spirochaetaceae bacterium]|nr:hypothetical protein [Spirochaetaceae bacterium]